MTDREAIDVLFNEWKCIDRNDGIHCDRKCESCDLVMDVGIIREAFNMAISALQEQEAKAQLSAEGTTSDLISRRVAVDALWEIRQKEISDGRRFHDYCSLSTAVDVIKDLPSAQPESEERKAESAQNVPKEDLISRKAAIDAVENIDCSDGVGISALKCEAVGDVVTAIKALPSAQPEPQWIPVGERLPDMWDERYLVSLAWGGIGVMEYKSTGFHNYGSFTPVPIESITAWMPLPEPYRAERRTDDLQ